MLAGRWLVGQLISADGVDKSGARAPLSAAIAFTDGSHMLQKKYPVVTEYLELENRGHSLVIEHGWTWRRLPVRRIGQ